MIWEKRPEGGESEPPQEVTGRDGLGLTLLVGRQHLYLEPQAGWGSKCSGSLEELESVAAHRGG